VLQVEQILNLRTDLMEAAGKLRRSEAERQTLESDITILRQQVRTGATYAASTVDRSCQHLAVSSGQSSTAAARHIRVHFDVFLLTSKIVRIATAAVMVPSGQMVAAVTARCHPFIAALAGGNVPHAATAAVQGTDTSAQNAGWCARGWALSCRCLRSAAKLSVRRASVSGWSRRPGTSGHKWTQRVTRCAVIQQPQIGLDIAANQL
jgi:hypothetical protein